jgi:hypothetical protein
MKERNTNLLIIKLVHSVIWVFFVSIIFYVLYCGMMDKVNRYTWIAIGFVLLEGAVLLIFRMSCPLTVVARKYSDSTKDNFDIFLVQQRLLFLPVVLFTGQGVSGKPVILNDPFHNFTHRKNFVQQG